MTTELPLFYELLLRNGLAGPRTVALRHTPREPLIRRSLADLIVRRHDLFNAYQSMQEGMADTMLYRADRLIAFVGDKPGRATLIGVYDVGERRLLDAESYWSIPANNELRAMGMIGPGNRADKIAFYDLRPTSSLADLQGRLIISWPGKELNWSQNVDERDDRFRVLAIETVSRFEAPPRAWREMVFTWADLSLLNPATKQRLKEWRGVYFIYDVERRLGYVGSAGGANNLLGRWTNYAQTGHGSNKLLRASKPLNLFFSILERTLPDLGQDELVSLESTWKERLHTRYPLGLNDN